MTDLSLQQILSSRFRTSAAADRHTVKLMDGLGLSTKASVARLAIGRSLGAGALNGEDVDAKGLEIPATSLFTQDDVAIWVGLIASHASANGAAEVADMDRFRSAVRRHWHRGAALLMEDWETNSENYDQFLNTLINRRANLPETGAGRGRKSGEQVKVAPAADATEALARALADIDVDADIKGHVHGPRVTRYKVFLPDINHLDKLKKGLERIGLALNLQSAQPVLSNGDEAKTVFLDVPRPKETWTGTGFKDLREWVGRSRVGADRLLVFPGVDVMGKPLSIDLTAAPHLLVGGATGMGKSVCLHSLILSLLMEHSPDTLRLALVDPKQVEFAVYRSCRYLLNNSIATDSRSARASIQGLVTEMEARYQQFSKLGATNISEARAKGAKLPFIVAFIEELADLVLQDKNVEPLLVRLAQKARAAGIHLVLATQRPDAKTFSGLIRSNIPTRIALTVQKSTESVIILDEPGAESLLGMGDMLIKRPGDPQPVRTHGVYVAREDIESYLKKAG